MADTHGCTVCGVTAADHTVFMAFAITCPDLKGCPHKTNYAVGGSGGGPAYAKGQNPQGQQSVPAVQDEQ